jgi:hypothetical protein
MADNTALNTGTGGDTIATDDLSTLNGGASGTVKVQRIKAGFGVDGDLNDVTPQVGMPVFVRPPVVLGSYMVAAQTGIYAGLAAGAILFSMRWSDATKICRVTRVLINVNTTTAASAAGMLDRDLVIVRSFSASDSGGTAITLTGNNAKARTSHATSVMADMRIASTGALTAGTGTADTQAVGLTTVQGTATQAVGLTIPLSDLLNPNGGATQPIILAANEGLRVRIPTAMPASIAQRTTVQIYWDELAAATSF